MLLLLLACAPEPEPPPPVVADCVPATPDDVRVERGDWYRCLDTTLQNGAGCGPDGYPLGFGAKYADRSFDVVYPDLGPDGQAFFEEVASCLQVELDALVTASSTCDEVWDAGFATHVGCYVESGFCELQTADLIALAGMFDEDAATLPEFQDAFTAVAEGCSQR